MKKTNNPPPKNLAKTYPEKEKKCHDVPEFVSRVPLLIMYYYVVQGDQYGFAPILDSVLSTTLKNYFFVSTYIIFWFNFFFYVMCLFI